MTTPLRRYGLSFEIAPPQAAHPNRTDIACFIGGVARRPSVAVSGSVPMPPVLAAWLNGLGFAQLGGLDVASLGVDLRSPATLQASLLAQAVGAEQAAVGHALSFDTLDSATAAQRRQQLADLVAACRDFTPVDAALLDDLSTRAWVPRRLLGPDDLGGWLRVQQLLNLPIAIDSFDAFDQLFAWQDAPVLTTPLGADDPTIVTPLGAAVRAFFGEGGRRCWIVRSGDPLPLFAPAATRLTAGNGQVPSQPVAGDAAAWQGLAHVYGLPEVSFACLPDLVAACADDVPAEVAPADVLAAPEAFHECAPEAPVAAAAAGRRVPAPRFSAAGLTAWQSLVNRALDLLANGGRAFHRRDVQLLASLPLGASDDLSGSFGNERLQLAFPWLLTPDSADCPGGIEAPEGTLAGVLARGALQRGAFRSIAGQAVTRYIAAQPTLDLARALQQAVQTPSGLLTFADRVCLIGPSARGPQLLSDVTTSADAATRQGAVRRLINVVIQAARNAGDEFAFEPNGPVLWQRVRERLGDLGRVLLAAGALSTDGPPFTVRCGRDTMTQADLDAGRLIAEIALLAAQPIQRIVVVLAMRDAPAVAERRAA